ncbi:MAG: ribonuclease Z [Flavobacteriaceae bacterium]|nr:ribonuclease Z [Flavobacteriaceae bacterium]
MLVEKKKNYTLIKSESQNFEIFLADFNTVYNNQKQNHLIVDLSIINDATTENINKLLILSAQSKSLKKSFVVVVKNIDIDLVSEKITCTPTLLEAEDTLEMEEMERDLGF